MQSLIMVLDVIHLDSTRADLRPTFLGSIMKVAPFAGVQRFFSGGAFTASSPSWIMVALCAQSM